MRIVMKKAGHIISDVKKKSIAYKNGILKGDVLLKINGEEKNAMGKTIGEYLNENGYDIKRVAVELNGDILPKTQYENTVLQDGDCVEIVSFVGGG